MFMLPHVGSELRVDKATQRYKPEGETSDGKLSYPMGHNP
jgi:hypothetical protein